MVHEFSVGDHSPRLAAEDERAAVNCGDERGASEDARPGAANEELVDREGRDDLHDPQEEGEADSLAHGRVRVPSDASMRVVRFRAEADEGLRDEG